MCDEIYRLGLSTTGTDKLLKPDPARCIWGMWEYEDADYEVTLAYLASVGMLCYFPSRCGEYCDGVCGDYLEKRKGE